MPIYQPGAIIANGRALVSIGERGELMAFYYPNIDFPQNLNQGMPALYIGEAGQGRLAWTFEPAWNAEQCYIGRSNIVRTVCHHGQLKLDLILTDFLLQDLDVMVRQVEIKNHSQASFAGIFYQYLDLQLGEVQARNGLRWLADRQEYVQYWRDLTFVISGDDFDQYGCGKARSDGAGATKSGLAKGHLNFQSQEIGDVDLAVGWQLRLAAGEEAKRLLFISVAESEHRAIAQLEEVRRRGFFTFHRQVEEEARQYLAKARAVRVPPDLEEGYWRGLLMLRMLFDEENGTFLAAPEFDPNFENSGGYGYCWPRDAVEVVLALEEVHLPEMPRRFLEWAKRTQNDDGSWEQRYWLSGERGPGWCSLEGCIQIDQVGSMLLAMEKVLGALPPADQKKELGTYWPTIKKAADYLLAQIDPKLGLHRPGFDLWETLSGSFTYTNGAIWAGLKAAARLAKTTDNLQDSDLWNSEADQLKRAIVQKLWAGTFFARGLDISNRLDPVVDSSILGLVEPFGLLDLNEECELEMTESCVETIMRMLSVDMGEGRKGIGRFEGDHYLGGSAGGVNTLWLAEVLLRLALVYEKRDAARSTAYKEQALEYLRLVKSCATAAGMLPELIGGPHATAPRWAAPHGWATASYIACMLLLDQLSER